MSEPRIKKWKTQDRVWIKDGESLGSVRDTLLQLVGKFGEDGRIDFQENAIYIQTYVEETDNQYAERVANLTKQREQQEQRERAEYARLHVKFGGAK